MKRTSTNFPAVLGCLGCLAGIGGGRGTTTSVLVIGPTSATTPATADPGLALQADFVHVVQAVRASVVEISTTTGLGSGVVYDNKGDIVTNAHVVGTEANFTVSLSNGKALPGHLVGTYAPDDLAVIKVSTTKGLTPARFGDSAALEVGDIVLAMGNPLGLSSSVTEGIVRFNGRAVAKAMASSYPTSSRPARRSTPGTAVVRW